MIQTKEEIEKWYSKDDPWEYEDNPDDLKRKDILLAEIPKRVYENVLDIGCGHGFITRDLPGERILGIDISEEAIRKAKNYENKRLKFFCGSIFELHKLFSESYDLIIITGVLYPQYIGDSSNLVYMTIDRLLKDNGILISVHIDEWYKCKFPYLVLKEYYYNYREYTHKLEIYVK
ncbi:MAG: class I SAM-dependent methyltransferase [Candidatus Atribacteria bacterium]|nr:class I SAM-dependent methyltransferase [Candidatus Atribacteria bacterium]